MSLIARRLLFALLVIAFFLNDLWESDLSRSESTCDLPREIQLNVQDNVFLWRYTSAVEAPDPWSFHAIKESCSCIVLSDVVVEQISGLPSRTFVYNVNAHFLIRYGTIIRSFCMFPNHTIVNQIKSNQITERFRPRFAQDKGQVI